MNGIGQINFGLNQPLLWLFGLFSALVSPDPLFSFGQGFVWIRFPLYVAAAQVWLAKDRDIRVLMLISMLVSMLIMCSILIAETFIEPKQGLLGHMVT